MNGDVLSLAGASRWRVGAILAMVSLLHFAPVAWPQEGGRVRFGEEIWPILAARCVTCHDANDQKGGLRLDSIEAIQKGSTFGPVVVAGKPAESTLYELVSLPADHRDRMPATGEPLTAEQQELIRRWIEEGADFGAGIPETLPAAADPDESATERPNVLAMLAEGVSPAPPEALAALRGQGAIAMPLDRQTPLVQVNLQLAGKSVDDKALEDLAQVADQVTWLNLARTGITDDGLAHVAGLKKLTRLHLEQTDVTDAGLNHLKDLPYLEYLNLYGTKVTDAGLDHLKGLSHLKRLYVWQTGVTAAGAESLAAALPELEVTLGTDLALLAAQAEAESGEEDTPAVLAALFTPDSCCAKAHANGDTCEHPCCVEAASAGTVCEKCNPGAGERAQRAALFGEGGCCAKAFAEGSACEHPCCVEAASAGTVCEKCNPGAGEREQLAALFDEGGCCAKAHANGERCEHPCCVEARADGRLCAKCNPAGAQKALADQFTEGSCCFNAHAQGKTCEHPCCVEAAAAGEVCQKCNPATPAQTPEAGPPGKTSVAERLAFNRDIRPILSNNCYLCHGPDAAQRKAGLRLDIREEALAARSGAAAIVPGDSGASALVARITHPKEAMMMPPPESERRLTPEQRELLARWIDEGAEYEPHWSYIAVERPEPPEAGHPDWVRNPVDRFVVAELDRKGVEPSPEADPVTLIRRLSFDLLGLPPTPEEVDTFVADTQPGAYERLVDRLLASPHYGERMAVDWLDQVRYADTNGFHGDEYRDVYPYRDYVIRAFNDNKPFDQFTIEQIGGDLLPDGEREQKVASAYNRLNQLTAEGGAQPGEYLAMYAADRVRTTTSAWMGATVGCAECHDHKFDPYTARDFYEFAAFFADIEEKGVYTAGGDWAPLLRLPSEAQEIEMAELEAGIARLEEALNSPSTALAESQVAWEAEVRQAATADANSWTALTPASAISAGGASLIVQDDRSILVTGQHPEQDTYTVVIPTNQQHITGIRLEALPHPGHDGRLSRGNGNFVLTRFTVAAAADGGEALPVGIAEARADFEQSRFPVSAAIDGKPNTGWAVDGSKKSGVEHEAVFTFEKPVHGGPGAVLTVTLAHESSHAHHALARFRLSITTAARPDVSIAKTLNEGVADLLWKAADARTDDEAERLAVYYRTIAPELEPVREERAALQARMEELEREIPRTLVTVATEPRVMRVLPRGNWMDESGDIVQPGTPHFLPPLGVEDRRPTRLDLANWLVDRSNPLTARVYVNRLWHMYFGTGLSKVLDDLGAQGEWPTHPGLLDWLAAEFMDSGWDVKHTVRLIVTSNAYRQASQPREDLQLTDPHNRLLARQARYRLEAELVRDNALAISGLLSDAMYGPSVKPYQPEGYWDNCNTFRGPLIYDTSEGEDQYRRGLYTFWKRSFLHPSLLAFDAPNREECTAERVISNTPLQALVLLNDPSYVEAARAFAERILREGGGEADARLTWAFRQALSRAPSDEERHALLSLCREHMAGYREDLESAVALIHTGQSSPDPELDPAELAAWTSVARVLLNLHEVITRT
jgi:hypothetical protein